MTYQSGRAGSSRYGACQASIARRHAGASMRAWPARSTARPPDRPHVRVYRFHQRRPAPNSTTGRSHAIANRTARRSPGARATVAASAAPPARVDGSASSGPRSSRPSAAKSAHRSRSATGSNPARHETSMPSPASAAMASDPRRAVGASAPGSPSSTATEPSSAMTRCGRAGAGPVAANGSAQVNRSPTVTGSGPGFSSHHSKTPTGRALRSRSPAMTGESCSPTTRIPPVTSGSNACHARGKSAWYVPPPTGSVQPQSGSSPGRSALSTVAREPDGPPTNSENPSAATGSWRCRPTSRCQRAASPR